MLNVENIITDGNPDFIPERLLVVDGTGAASPVISESRKIYKMATLEGLIVNYGRKWRLPTIKMWFWQKG